ncbi:MAG: hypothetical protein FJ100_02835 [Deltaproteobacteria bacterium]|nr:hypothetical protein [Deltaproteobacteria bacterium]
MRTGRAIQVGLCAALCLACGKSVEKPAAPGQARAPAVGLPGAATPTAADPEAAKARLSKAALAARCQLTGYAAPDDSVYVNHGFADAAAFGQAWDDVAKLDPKWAETELARLYAQACPGHRAAPPPRTATPAGGEATP